MKKLLLSLSFLVAALVSKGQLIQQYNFVGAAGNETTFAPDGQPENGILSDIKRGTGVSPSPGGGSFSGVNFTLDPQVDTSDYYDFGIAANSGFFLSLDSIVFGERRSNTGIRKFAIRSSLDNFASDLQVFDVPDSANFRYNQKLVLGESFKNLTGGTAVHFRYFGFQAESNAGTWRLDSIRVHGVITSSPLSNQTQTVQKQFQIFPNPGSDFLQIETKENTSEAISIFSSTGILQTEWEPTGHLQKVNTQSWSPGLYIIRRGKQNHRWIKY